MGNSPSSNDIENALNPNKNGVVDFFDPNKGKFNSAFDPAKNGVSDAFNPNKNGFINEVSKIQDVPKIIEDLPNKIETQINNELKNIDPNLNLNTLPTQIKNLSYFSDWYVSSGKYYNCGFLGDIIVAI